MMSFLRSAFVKGAVMALAFVAPIPVLNGAVVNPPDPCNLQTWPVEARDWISTVCEAHDRAGFSGDPAAIYELQKEIVTAGKYVVISSTTGAAPGSVSVVDVIRLDLKHHAPDAYAAGHEAGVVIGNLNGPTGNQVPMLFLTSTISQSGQPVNRGLIPIKILSQDDYDMFARNARLAGGVRLIDSSTGKSYGLDDTLPGSVVAAMAHPTDLSSVYCTFQNGLDPGIDPRCVRAAYETQQNDRTTALEEYNACVAAVYAAWAIITLGCGLYALPPAGLLGFGICMAIAASELAIGMALCTSVYNSKLRGIERQLIIDLRACGVIIAEI
jgi:hypothetical protein